MKKTQKSGGKRGTLHPKNPHGGRYNFAVLTQCCPALKQHLRTNPRGDSTIDFSDREAVLCLNKALLSHYYQINHWAIPNGYLCPPVPGRADYIHYLAELLTNSGRSVTGSHIRALDIGTGANCIYPIIGNRSYGWRFVATDIDPLALKAARLIVDANPPLKRQITFVQQHNRLAIFKGVIKRGEQFTLTLCNPPFHASMEEALNSNRRKAGNLNGGQSARLNFGGQQQELWTLGARSAFWGFVELCENPDKIDNLFNPAKSGHPLWNSKNIMVSF